MRAILLPAPILLLASLLRCQATEPEHLPQFLTPIHTQADDPEGGAYGIWGAGADYKVSFHDGATFVPYLGGEYPVTQTWRWHTTSVTVDATELATRERPLGRQVSDARYEYEFSRVDLSGLPPNWLAAVAVSFGTANAPIGGIAGFGSGCWVLIDPFAANFIGFLPTAVSNVLGLARSPIFLPESLPPGWLYFQAMHPDAGFVDLLLTQRLEVLLTY